ncbi:MAG: hypothetical protein K0R98_1433 [Rickettsiaceae bacterium]|jgi:hypothetical protein|nr:hypothetical protein [Rickettsiaceae bacterium]
MTENIAPEISKNSEGFVVSVTVTVDKNTATLIRALRKSDTPISNGAKPTDIPVIGEKLPLVSEQNLWNSDKIDQKYAEDFAKRLIANITSPEHLPDYADKVAHKDEKSQHKAMKSKQHFTGDLKAAAKPGSKVNGKAQGGGAAPKTRKPSGQRGS